MLAPLRAGHGGLDDAPDLCRYFDRAPETAAPETVAETVGSSRSANPTPDPDAIVQPIALQRSLALSDTLCASGMFLVIENVWDERSPNARPACPLCPLGHSWCTAASHS